jgi:Spy/CpxP family protein refolding chaperone
MKLSLRKVVTFVSLASTLALLPSAVALADQGGEHAGHHRGGHREGLVGAALKLDSLTPEQRSSIEQLVQARRDAGAAVRHADARVLDELAQQVEQAKIDTGALEPGLSAERSAAVTESAVEKDTLTRLHAVLTPAQRAQVVDALEAQGSRKAAHGGGHRGEHPEGGGKLGLTPEQKTQIRANLRAEAPAPGERTKTPHNPGQWRTAIESFRGDAFDAASLVHVEARGEHAEKLATAMVPVLSPGQRATFAGELRARAVHENEGR